MLTLYLFGIVQKHTKILLCLALVLTPILTSLAHAQTDLARADFDGNRKVDIQDFLAFAAAFGKTSSEKDFDNRMDFNGDNTVNIQDFLAFVAVFGQSVELKDLADYPVGVSLQTKYLTDDARVSIVKKTFSSITGGWEMKPKPISTGPGTYDWRRADALVDFAEANNMQVHGHTLLWHNAVPTWMENFSGDDAAFEAAIKEYITTVVQRYRGRVVSWDVVNEGIGGNGKVRDNLFSQRMGNDYIARMFQYAREADPDVLLFYNDYGTSQPWARAKRAGMLNMLDDFQTRGIPIDGVGLQMHISYKSPDISAIRETINEIVRRGLKLHISELDIRMNPDGNLSEPTQERLELQKKRVIEIVTTFHQVPEAQRFGITVWGIADPDTWLIQAGRSQGRPEWPLLFDDHLQPKPAYDGFVEALQNKGF